MAEIMPAPLTLIQSGPPLGAARRELPDGFIETVTEYSQMKEEHFWYRHEGLILSESSVRMWPYITTLDHYLMGAARRTDRKFFETSSDRLEAGFLNGTLPLRLATCGNGRTALTRE